MLMLINMKHKACSLAGMLHHAKWHLLPVSMLKGNLKITLRSSNTNPPLTSLENQHLSLLPLWIQYTLLDRHCEFGLLLPHIFQCSLPALLHARNLTIMVFTCFEISQELLSIGIGFMSDLLEDNELNLGLSSTDKFGNLTACSVWVENGDRLVGWVADLRKRELSKLWLFSKRGNGAKCPRSYLLLLWRRGRNPEQGNPEMLFPVSLEKHSG